MNNDVMPVENKCKLSLPLMISPLCLHKINGRIQSSDPAASTVSTLHSHHKRKDKSNSILWFLQKFRTKNKSFFEDVASLPPSPQSVHRSRWESIESVWSSATTTSFNFIRTAPLHTKRIDRPASPSSHKPAHETSFPPTAAHDKTDFLRCKYNLLGSDTSLYFNSDERKRKQQLKNQHRNSIGNVENLKVDNWSTSSARASLKQRPKSEYNISTTSNQPPKTYCHKPGKGRAPPPPHRVNTAKVQVAKNTNPRKKRKAPSPPKRARMVPQDMPQQGIIFNDSLKLEKGQLKANKTNCMLTPSPSSSSVATDLAAPVPVSPKPWYKRSPKRGSKKGIGKSLNKKKPHEDLLDEWMLEVGLPRNSLYLNELKPPSTSPTTLNESKRKSQLSMLPNISELDREAAEIIRKERKRENDVAAYRDEKFYNQISSIRVVGEDELCTEKKHTSKHQLSILNAMANETEIAANASVFNEAPAHKDDNLVKLDKSISEADSKLNQLTITEINEAHNDQIGASGESKTSHVATLLSSSIHEANAPAVKPIKPFSSWMCPQCTLENPSWKFICEACNKWRPYSVNKLSVRRSPVVVPKEDAAVQITNFKRIPTASSLTKEREKINKISENIRKQVYDILTSGETVINNLPRLNSTDKCHTRTSSIQSVHEIERIRKARLNFFSKNKRLNDLNRNDDALPSSSNDNNFDIKVAEEIKNNKYYSEDDRRKLREILNELKDSLPKDSSDKKKKIVAQTESVSSRIAVSTTGFTSQTNYAGSSNDETNANIEFATTKEYGISDHLGKVQECENEKDFVSKVTSNLKLASQNNLKCKLGAVRDTKNVTNLMANRLLKKLQAAIAGGLHHEAANIARELARLKVNCSMSRQEYPDTFFNSTQNFIVNIHIRNNFTHQVAYPLKCNFTLTLNDLKLKMFNEYDIPVEKQRWMFKGKALNDNSTLEQMGIAASECFDVYLYPEPEITASSPVASHTMELTSNIDTIQNFNINSHSASENASVFRNGTDTVVASQLNNLRDSSVDSAIHNNFGGNQFNSTALQFTEIPILIHPQNEAATTGKLSKEPNTGGVHLLDTSKTTLEWKCHVCTLVNFENEKMCEVCGSSRHRGVPMYETKINADNYIQKNDQILENTLTNYQQLIDMEKADVITNVAKFNCSVCLLDYQSGEGIVLKDCLHTFCRDCLVQTVQHSSDAEVKCPYRDDNYSCESTLQEREIKSIVSNEIYEQHLSRSVSEAENKITNTFHCKTVNCKGWCIFEDNVNEFHCPVCNKNNCLTCQVIHMGLNCRQYQEIINKESDTNVDANRTRMMLQEMLEKGEAMTCPTCQIIVMKKWGCDWLRCSMCKTEICWVTRGPRWGPNGKGDTTAGCRCGVKGVKCHPRCTYCH